VKGVGEYSWLLSFEDGEERRANERARAVAGFLKGLAPEGLVEAIPAARTVFVVGTPRFDAGVLTGLEAVALPVPEREPRQHEVRIAPDGEDVEEVSDSSASRRASPTSTVFPGSSGVRAARRRGSRFPRGASPRPGPTSGSTRRRCREGGIFSERPTSVSSTRRADRRPSSFPGTS